MKNIVRIKAMNVDEMSIELTSIYVAVIQKITDNLTDILKIERQIFPQADKKEIFDAYKEWLEREE